MSLTKEGDKYALVYDTPEGRVQVGRVPKSRRPWNVQHRARIGWDWQRKAC